MTAEQERTSGTAPAPVLTVAAVARRLGVAPSTLRTWDRRYGLGPSAHTAGSHRRYGPDDLRRLSMMRGLTLEGVPPAEAAQIALGTRAAGPGADDRPLVVPSDPGHRPADDPDRGRDGDPVPGQIGGLGGSTFPALPLAAPGRPAAFGALRPAARPDGPGEAGHRGQSVRPLAGATSEPGRGAAVWITREPLPGAQRAVPPVEALDLPDPSPGAPAPLGPVAVPGALGSCRAGGGRVLSLPDASPRARGLARAAMALDTFEQHRILRDAVAVHGVVGTWESLVAPVLAGLGERWQATGEGVDVEHAFCETVTCVLRGITTALPRPRNAVPVLLACADGDQHVLPLHGLAAALAEEGVASRMLGAGLPSPALVSAVRRTGPTVVFLYARLPAADAAVLGELPRQRPAPRVLVGGQGWDGAALPTASTRVGTLPEAVAAVLGGARL